MTAKMPNCYCPEQVRALQAVFDGVWLLLSEADVMSRNDLASLIFALAADGGADDSDEINVDQLSQETLQCVVQLSKERIRSRRQRVRVMSTSDYMTA
ncbi:MAG: hypothetical protein HOP09_05685 [Hyphomicrobium sp.]|nr:hypothetical protein [Hyphomicrobium sp.]